MCTTIKLTHDQLDDIVVNRLQESYTTLVEAINVLESRDSLLKHEVKDLAAHKRDLRATRRVLRYYMVKEDFENFMETIK